MKNDNDEAAQKQEDNNISNKKSKKKRSAASFMTLFFVKIGVTALIVLLLLTFVAGIYVNHNNSSYPMVKDGDFCLTYKLAKLSTGDEIAYIHDGKVRIGRIVAMPGDTLDVSEGNLTINGYGAYEDAVYPTTVEGITISLPYTVPQDSYFVLNDYRDDITDSRSYGAIPKSDTKGKIILLLRMRGF